MVEPDNKDPSDLEVTVRHLREENAKLLQLLRSQGLLTDLSTNPNVVRSTDSISSTCSQSSESSPSVTFDHSDLTCTTNEIQQEFVNNHGIVNQQNYAGQIVHGNQSNLTPNFNTIIQNTTQPFVQNNSNTLVQNNTNLIQPINLNNNVVYLSQSSSSSTTTTTTTTSNSNSNESLISSTHSILPEVTSEQSTSSQISIRSQPPSALHPNQELIPVIPRIRPEHFDSIAKQYAASSSTNETSNLLDSDSNDPKQKFPRPIRPKPSSRANALKSHSSAMINEKKSSSSSSIPTTHLNNSPTISLFSTSPSDYVSHSNSMDHFLTSTSQNSSFTSLPSDSSSSQKSSKARSTNRKKTTTMGVGTNVDRSLASAPSNVQRSSTTRKPTKRKLSKTLVADNSETNTVQGNTSPSNAFADSISGFLENFNQELLDSNILPPSTTTTSNASTSNLLSDENDSIMPSNSNIIGNFDHIDLRHLVNGAIQHQDSFHSSNLSVPTILGELSERLDQDAPTHDLQSITDFNVENEPIASFMSEEDMHLVAMNFDENTFLKQFDLEDAQIKLSVHSDQNLFANLLTHNLNQSHSQQSMNDSTPLPLNSSPVSTPPLTSMYPGSSLINNNVFTTLVPLGSHQKQILQRITTSTSNTNAIRLMPEEGVQLTARHIEPQQVATYESTKYQDILDDLVMVTDQDALQHAQAAAASDPSIVSSDFTFALLEVTNEILKDSTIQVLEATNSAFTELQYFYPIEQGQTEKSREIQQQQKPIAILEKLQSEILTAAAELNATVVDESMIQTAITDLSALLQFESTDSPSEQNTTITELITPVHPTRTTSHQSPSKSPIQPIAMMDIDSLLPPELSISTAVSSSADQSTTTATVPEPSTTSKSSISFEPISSPSSRSAPVRPSEDEMIIDSGRLEQISSKNNNFTFNDDDIEALLRETTPDPYEILGNLQPISDTTTVGNNTMEDDVDEPVIEDQSKPAPSLEHTFHRYQKKYRLILQRQYKILSKKPHEQLLTIPSVKLKLHSIYPHKSSKKKKKRKSRSPSPQPTPIVITPSPQPAPIVTTPLPPPVVPKQSDEEPVERPRIKITIRTKLPALSPVPSPTVLSQEKEQEPKNSRKSKKKKSHHHHHHSNHQSKKKTIIVEQPETEYAGLTRFEQPLAQMYRQQPTPTPDETSMKHEVPTSSPPTIDIPQTETSTTIPHSGFMIDEQTPPSSITSIEHKNSPPPLLSSQTKTDKLRLNYSHLFSSDHHHEQQNNNTFITPPPEIDFHLQSHQQRNPSCENFYPFSNSPAKKKDHRRKSSVTSSTSSKSLTIADYSIDTQALEPVSPTPLTSSKSKHSQNRPSSSSSTSSITATSAGPSSSDYYNLPSNLFEHHQPRSATVTTTAKEHHSSSKKSSSSSSRSSKTNSSRSLSNQNYRSNQDSSILPSSVGTSSHPPSAAPSSLHLDPYGSTYHPFDPRTAAAPFFNFPFAHPFLNPHGPAAATHFHPHSSMKHYSSHHHSSHAYATHPPTFPYHPHLQRQQQYNNSNYMSSRDR